MNQADSRGGGLSVLMADDQWLFRAGARRLLEDLPYDLAVKEAKDGAEAIDALNRDRFDLVLLDHVMPDILPVPLLNSVTRRAEGAAVVVLSAADEPDQVWTAIEAGASGFLPKTCSPEVMLQAIQLVLSGEVYIPATVLARGRSLGPEVAGPNRPCQREGLTAQQDAILQYLANGFSNKEIANALDIAEGTVKSHIAGLFRRLGAKNRTHAIIIAAQRGLLSPLGKSDGPA